MHRIKRGLDLPIEGAPLPQIDHAPPVRRVALIGDDYVGMKPTMAVQEGDPVKRGQLLFADRKTPGVQFTSPAGGRVAEVNRGAKRHFQSVVIEVEGDLEGEGEAEGGEPFARYDDGQLSQLSAEEVRRNLLQSGLWTAFRSRPYSKTPAPDTSPHSIFVTAIDTHPLAAPPQVVIEQRSGDFARGLELIAKLTEGAVYVCTDAESDIPPVDNSRVRREQFVGPHPAGLPGTHIHFLDPAHQAKTVWHLNYQDVIAVGQLFVTGRLPVERVISLAGPAVKEPRLLRTRLGASIAELVAGELVDGDTRVISGSVLSGREARGPLAFLGRYHLQVAALRQGGQRVLLDWLRPGGNRYSIKNVYASALLRAAKFAFTTSQEGSRRPLVPIGMYEKVMPLDILPTCLLRALIVGDTQQAQDLGCLELDEEDLALCSFVCPGKYEYGPLLRECLTRLEQEG